MIGPAAAVTSKHGTATRVVFIQASQQSSGAGLSTTLAVNLERP